METERIEKLTRCATPTLSQFCLSYDDGRSVAHGLCTPHVPFWMGLNTDYKGFNP